MSGTLPPNVLTYKQRVTVYMCYAYSIVVTLAMFYVLSQQELQVQQRCDNYLNFVPHLASTADNSSV